MSKQTVAFIGLGVMGYPMAGHLSKAGYNTRVYNRSTARVSISPRRVRPRKRLTLFSAVSAMTTICAR